MEDNTCGYCKKKFAKLSTLTVHLCEPKRRMQQRDETGVRLGLQAYQRFYQISQGSALLKTYEDFAGSSYYRAFVKFGWYCHAVRAVNVSRFIDWVLKKNKKIDHWCRDSVYDEYLMEHLQTEAAVDAVARSLEQAIEWEESTGHPACDYLRHANANAVCYQIRSGRVSAWVLYNSAAGVEFLERASQEQIAMIWPYIDTEHWQQRFKDHPKDTEYVRSMLTQAGW